MLGCYTNFEYSAHEIMLHMKIFLIENLVFITCVLKCLYKRTSNLVTKMDYPRGSLSAVVRTFKSNFTGQPKDTAEDAANQSAKPKNEAKKWGPYKRYIAYS